MKRFLLVLALVAVAGATYIAAAPGGQPAGPTAKQFKALVKQVKELKKQLKTVHDCMIAAVPIRPYGDYTNEAGPAWGYEYVDPAINSGAQGWQTALNLTPGDDPEAGWITVGTAKCGADIGTARRHAGRLPGANSRAATLPAWATRH